MKLILKYFKPFLLMAVVSILLLFSQNIMDLFLPRYMSQMVDIGIMQGGITEAVPKALSAYDYDQLMQYSDISYLYIHSDTIPADYPKYDVAKDWVLAPEYTEVANDAMASIPHAEVYQTAVWSVRNGAQTELDRSAPLSNTQTAANYTQEVYERLGADKIAIQQKSILNIGIIMLLITLCTVIVTIANGFLSAKISTGIGRNLRRDVFGKVQTFSPAEFDKFSTATLITRCTNDVQQVQMVAMMGLRMILSAPITGIGGIVMALETSKRLSWIVAVAVVILLALQVIMFSNVTPKFRIMQKLQDKLNLVTRESLSGMMVIRAFGNEEKEYERFRKANDDISKTNLFVQRAMAAMQPSMQFIMGCTTLTVILLGTKAISNSELQIGQMMAFMQYVMQIMMSFMMIGMMFIMIPRALVSATRLSEVLDTQTAIDDKPKNELKELNGRAKGELRFNNVSFMYQDAEKCVLENIDFTAKAGETTAFIGSTGSGKSTLINLIPRFYDVTSGSITLDGVDIRDISVKELRDNLGYVPQKGILFSGDIESNLSYGKENANEDELRTAISVAQAEQFVYADKNGLRTEIAQGGDNVSGGQKQRLSIARALVKQPPIYIFDDSFSALDFRTDAALRRALRENTNSSTKLIVAQRVSTIMNAEQIIVLDAGRIIGKGTHKELLETCDEYREIAESQLSKEELL